MLLPELPFILCFHKLLVDRFIGKQIVLMYYLIGLKDRKIGEIFGLAKSSVCKLRHDAIKTLRRLMEELYHG